MGAFGFAETEAIAEIGFEIAVVPGIRAE